MKVIWKQELKITDEQTIMLPVGSEILYAKEQVTGHTEVIDKVCIWFTCDPTKDKFRQSRTFYIRGTGHEYPEGKVRYLGSAHLNNDSLIFHVFEALTDD